MKPKTRKMFELEYDALVERVIAAGWIVTPSLHQSGFTMITSDFLVTQSMAEARWIYCETPIDILLFQVDGINDAILLIPEGKSLK